MKSVEVIIVCPRYHASNLDVAPGSVHSRMTFLGKGIHVKPLFATGILGGGSDPTFFGGRPFSSSSPSCQRRNFHLIQSFQLSLQAPHFTRDHGNPLPSFFMGFGGSETILFKTQQKGREKRQLVENPTPSEKLLYFE